MAKKDLHPFVKASGAKDEETFLNMYPTEEHFFNSFPEYREGGSYLSADGNYEKASGTGTWDAQSGTYFQFGGQNMRNTDTSTAPIPSKRGKISKSVYLPHPAIHKFDEGGVVEYIDLSLQGITKDLQNQFIDTNQKYKSRPDRSVDEGLRNVEHYSTPAPKPEECEDCDNKYKLGGNYEDFLYNKFQFGGGAMNTANFQAHSELTPSGEIKRKTTGVTPFSSGTPSINYSFPNPKTPTNPIFSTIQPSYSPSNPFVPTVGEHYNPGAPAPLNGASNKDLPYGCEDDLNNFVPTELQGGLKYGGYFQVGGTTLSANTWSTKKSPFDDSYDPSKDPKNPVNNSNTKKDEATTFEQSQERQQYINKQKPITPDTPWGMEDSKMDFQGTGANTSYMSPIPPQPGQKVKFNPYGTINFFGVMDNYLTSRQNAAATQQGWVNNMTSSKYQPTAQMGGQQQDPQQQEIPDLKEGEIYDLNPKQIKLLLSQGFEIEAVKSPKVKRK